MQKEMQEVEYCTWTDRTAGPEPGQQAGGNTPGSGLRWYSRTSARNRYRRRYSRQRTQSVSRIKARSRYRTRYSMLRTQTVQQDQSQDKIQEDILEVDDTGHTAGPGQNTGGDIPSSGHRR
jgi:hypothetical protein